MYSPPLALRNVFRRLCNFALALSLAAVSLALTARETRAQFNSFKNFEGPQIHPLALTPDGTRLLAVNTPNGTLSVFQITSGSPVLTAEIPVGLEPVSVAARSEREAWVVNWLSDSVSVVDLSTGNVVRTIQVGDEPTDVTVVGVRVSLSGSQSAATTTDSLGRFTFTRVSTAGTHTVTPDAAGLTFQPQSRTFATPKFDDSAVFITSATANAADSSEFFVREHYNDFLSREPDAAGLAFWVNEIEKCNADQQCCYVRRINVSAAFFLSIEHQNTGYTVYKTYKASFGNLAAKPVPLTLDQLMTDAQRIGRGVVVGVGNWQALLETNRRAFFQGWVQRPEFIARFPVGMSAASFVDTLNANTGGSLNGSERDTIVNQLNSNNSTQGRAAAVRAVVENAEFSFREKNRAFVLMQYFGYLRRNPDDAPQVGLNFEGYNFWLTKLDQFNGNFVAAEMVKAFIASDEYRQRFGR